MAGDRYVFDGLERFEKRLRRMAAEVDYLVVWDRTDRSTEDTLGRFALTVSDALPYLVEAEELADTPDGDDSDDPTEDDDPYGRESTATDEPEDDAVRAQRVLGRTPGPADFAVAAGRWLRDVATRNMGGDGQHRFRVKAYSPKGARVVETCTFSCRDDDPEAEVRSPLALVEAPAVHFRIPTPTFEQVETYASSRGMKALGDYYAQFGHILLGSVGQVQQINNGMLGRLHRDLDQSREQVDKLLAAMLNLRVAETELADERAAANRTDETRAVIAQQALAQLGEAAKAFLATKGLVPEIAEAVGVIGQPRAGRDAPRPRRPRADEDPANLRMVADLLKHAAQQARMLREPVAKAG